MTVSTKFLQDYLSRTMSAKAMADSLEQAGIEIEQIMSSITFDDKVVIGHVKKVVQHPDADRLKLATVDLGSSEVEVVCGAPNVREGLIVAFAQVGAILPGDFEIKQAKIRGVVSNGMICSARELGISDDHAGVLELDDSFEPGKALCDLWPSDEVLDIKTPANRFDVLSVVGLAREIVSQAGGELKLPTLAKLPVTSTKPVAAIEAEELVKRYLLQRVKLNAAHPTDTGSKLRLESSGVRPINLPVDVTNYVLLELGQPLHAFDATKVKLPIAVRHAQANEKLVTLDGVERALTAADLIIADAKGPIALAGVMGGKGSEVTTESTEIIIESATFDAATVRKMAQRHGLRTEASARFERQLVPELAEQGLRRAIEIITLAVGGEAVGEVTDIGYTPTPARYVGFTPAQIQAVLGVELTAKQIIHELAKLDLLAVNYDLKKAAQAELDKPYKAGANLVIDGEKAYTCGTLTQYLYAKIGVVLGGSGHEQYASGSAVDLKEIRPGDLVFRADGVVGNTDTSKTATHVAIYIGGDKIIHAKSQERAQGGVWQALKHPKVTEESLEHLTADPGFLGVRRYREDVTGLLSVAIPWWRPDIALAEDIAEELVRLIGYDAIPSTLPAWAPQQVEFDRQRPLIWRLKSSLKAADLFEVITYSFVSAQQLTQVGYKLENHLKLQNPLSIEQAYLRSNLLPSLLSSVQRNDKYAKRFGLFEISGVFQSNGAGKLPDEPVQLGVILKQPSGGYQAGKAVLDSLIAEFNLDISVNPVAYAEFHPARSVELRIGKLVIGRLGEVHPDILAPLKLSGSVVYLELALESVLAHVRPKGYQAMSRFPSIQRDIAMVVAQNVTWAQVSRTIAETNLAKVNYLNEYHGAGIPAGHKSLALRLTMTSLERTLTDEEASARQAKIMKRLQGAFGAKLRVE
jgi:phenylalanyl-tRNA synthetase beta subunit